MMTEARYTYDKTLYDRGTRAPCPNTFLPGWITRTNLHDSWRITTSRAPRPRSPWRPRSLRGHHVIVARPALFPPGAIRGAAKANLASPRPRPGRAGRSGGGQVLRPSPRGVASAGFPRRATADLECTPGWDGNWTHDCFIVFGWQGADDGRFVVAVNFAPNQSQCHVMPRPPSLCELGGQAMEPSGSTGTLDLHLEWRRPGESRLFLDMTPWQACVFQLTS